MQIAEKLAQNWLARLQVDCPNYDRATYESIISWLLGKDLARFEELTASQLAIAEQAMDYRYRILLHRYLGVGPERAYRNLITRLGSLVMLRNKIKTWVSLSRDRHRAVVDVLQEVIQELLHSDRYLQQQIAWITKCSSDSRLRNALLLASAEEYCLRPIRNQPLLLYRFVNYLRRSGRGGITHVPTGDLVRLVSEEVMPEDADNPVSLLDAQAMAQYQETQAWEERMAARTSVKQEFESYLVQTVGPVAQDWLELYLQGRSQEEIARTLDKPIKEIYRLREKISYHAVRVFALKIQPELVANWLETSLQEHHLGLTPSQWQEYCSSLTPEQRLLLDKLATGKTLEAIAQDLNLKTNQVMGEWSKLYLAAQEKRSPS
ncbi:HetZ-related protein 2 [Argonema galeatum]|uniref:HetZ-related protein 2 n=1 Tax=Argonema galeatum TaxID=2942762 RepID=UPI00201108C7|nr:HetZ-related protein 2 [Argonema galeatum]MCL1463992.1 HetZ-related protein 2 [Argonema galeatum A003/A1]